MSILNFDIPGDAKFPLNALYGKPQDRNEAGEKKIKTFSAIIVTILQLQLNFAFFEIFIDQCRAYVTQMRQELGQRIVEKVYDPQTNKPSKVS